MSQVIAERDGRVLTVRLSNPPRNFMTNRMVVELTDLVRGLRRDRSVGAVVLTGAVDRVFITHFDVAEILRGSEAVGLAAPRPVAGGMLRAAGALRRLSPARRALERSPAAGIEDLRRIHELFTAMNRSDKTFVAAINGLAMGGGCELALACDVRLMADEPSARIGFPEITLGLMPGGGGTQRLPRMVGSGRALEIMLGGRTLTPAEAERYGMVHRVVAPDRLLDDATATAARLARRSPATVRAIKRAVYEDAARPLSAGLHAERAAFAAIAARPAAIRAMRAYVDEVEAAGGDVSPEEADAVLARYRAGEAVELVSD